MAERALVVLPSLPIVAPRATRESTRPTKIPHPNYRTRRTSVASRSPNTSASSPPNIPSASASDEAFDDADSGFGSQEPDIETTSLRESPRVSPLLAASSHHITPAPRVPQLLSPYVTPEIRASLAESSATDSKRKIHRQRSGGSWIK